MTTASASPIVHRSIDIHGNPVEFTDEDVVGHECRHVTYCPQPEGAPYDIHAIKRVTHLKNGTMIPNIHLEEDYQVPYWITKKGRQNYREKRECSSVEDLDMGKVPRRNLISTLANKLNVQLSKRDRKDEKSALRVLARKQYLYGVFTPSTSLIKKRFMKRYPQLKSLSTVACTDTETNMFSKEQEIIMQTISFKSRVFVAIKKSFFEGEANIVEEIQKRFEYYLADDIKARNLKLEIKLVDTAGQVVVETMKKAHEWRPDFVAIWNIKFDMVKMLEALKADGIDPAVVFSDPKVVKKGHHFFDWKLGPSVKKKSNGQEEPLSMERQWHVATCPASFYFIDAMCTYRQLRQGAAEERSYSLDSILQAKVERQKLKFKEADGFVAGEWHKFMQENYKFEYVIYNNFDCIGMEILDEATGDLSLNLPLNSDASSYAVYPSQPTRLCNELFFFLLERGKVIGTTSDQMSDENDKLTVIGKGWITMLRPDLKIVDGLKIIEEMIGFNSNIYVANGDLDITATYPTEGIVMNISKFTTHRELVSIDGVPDAIRRRFGFNLAGGHVNAVEICHDIFKMPTHDQMLVSYLRKQGKLH